VFGLGARYDLPESVTRVFQVKGRPNDNPLIVHCAQVSQILRVADLITRDAKRLLSEFAPGPLTVILPRNKTVADGVTGGLDTVAVRVPKHPLAVQLIAAVGIPLVAPSANRSGKPSPTTWEAVVEDLGSTIDGILIGEPTTIGLESSVVDCSQTPARLLRLGGISFESLQEVIPDIQLATENDPAKLRSPGMRYRHYSPRAAVVLVNDPSQALPSHSASYLGNSAHPLASAFGEHCFYTSVEDYARDLYEAFRRADRAGRQVVYCLQVNPVGIGTALMDRIKRASHS
jgi:L-threonylcarbamoyladenylate synthase